MPNAPERIFLDWDMPALVSAAAHLADACAGKREIRLDRAVLVLPGARAGRRLLEVLIDEADRRGLRLRPPRVATVGGFPELLYAPAAPLADRVLTRRVWAETLRTFAADRLDALFPNPPDADETAGWEQLARQIQRLHREIGGAGMGFGEVADRCAEELPFDDGDRWRALAAIQDRYLARLDALGHADREFARIEALRRGAVASTREIWVVGVVELPGVLRRMLRAVDAPVRALVHAPADRADGFDDDGCVLPDAWSGAEVPLEDRHVAVGDRPADQAAEALRAIEALDGRYSAEEITIGVPHDEVVPYLEQRLSTRGLPARYAAGIRLDRTAPYRLLAAVADYLDDRRFDALAALLRHPDLGRWWADSDSSPDAGPDGEATGPGGRGDLPSRTTGDALTTADRYFGRAFPARVERPLAGDDAARRAAMASVVHRVDDALLDGLDGRRRLAEWAERILAVLVRVYGGEPPDRRGRRAHRRIVEACERLRDAAVEFHRLPAAVDEPCPASTAIRLLLSEAGSQTIPPEPEDAAIELLGWLELHLDDAPALIVTGFNEPHLPESVIGDAFLPNALRARLGLADNASRYARDAYQLTAILRSRPAVKVIAGRRDASGDPLRPSRLLFAAPASTAAERVLRFYDEGRDRASAPAASARPAPGTESRFRLPPEPEIRARDPLRELRVTDFRRLLSDPYRFALERVLRLRALDDHAHELDGAAFGALAHDVLRDFGRSDDVRATDPDVVAARLDALLDDTVGRRFGRAALPAVRVQIEQLRARLHAFAAWHADWVERGWRVVAVERRPEDGVPFPVDGEPILLRGRIDRIDRHVETGEWALFDYKTSDRATDPEATHRKGRRDAKEWVDLQLPLYRHLLPALDLDDEGMGRGPGREQEGTQAAVAGADRTAGSGAAARMGVRLGYIRLPRNLDEVGPAFADWDADALASADEAARAVVRLVRENRFVFDPERVELFRDDPLAELLGEGSLAALADAEDEGGAR